MVDSQCKRWNIPTLRVSFTNWGPECYINDFEMIINCYEYENFDIERELLKHIEKYKR